VRNLVFDRSDIRSALHRLLGLRLQAVRIQSKAIKRMVKLSERRQYILQFSKASSPSEARKYQKGSGIDWWDVVPLKKVAERHYKMLTSSDCENDSKQPVQVRSLAYAYDACIFLQTQEVCKERQSVERMDQSIPKNRASECTPLAFPSGMNYVHFHSETHLHVCTAHQVSNHIIPFSYIVSSGSMLLRLPDFHSRCLWTLWPTPPNSIQLYYSCNRWTGPRGKLWRNYRDVNRSNSNSDWKVGGFHSYPFTILAQAWGLLSFHLCDTGWSSIRNSGNLQVSEKI